MNLFHLRTLSALGLCAAFASLGHHAAAQISSPAGLSGADLAALRGALGVGTMGGAGLNLGTGLSGGSVVLASPGGTDEDAQTPQDATAQREAQARRSAPLPPNEFQKFITQTTGKHLPLFGAEYFLNTLKAPGTLNTSPVGRDYRLRVGDALQVRLWGPVEAQLSLTVDRNGDIALPKLGTVTVAGLTAVDAERAVKEAVGRQHKNFGISVVPGRLRKLQVSVVGLARFPGTYSLTSEATLTTALFASGGPGLGGSMRRVQLRRQGQLVTEFDLYAFLSLGDKAADTKLQEGDVLVFPPASGFAAVHGAVDQPSVVELKGASETIADLFKLIGGVPVTADARRITLERVVPDQAPARRVQDVLMAEGGGATPLRSGDVLTVWPIVAESADGVVLTGAVARPTKFAWRPGMRVSDLLQDRSLLQSPDAVRQRDELLFDDFERERAARLRARAPDDLMLQRLPQAGPGAEGQDPNQAGRASTPGAATPVPLGSLAIGSSAGVAAQGVAQRQPSVAGPIGSEGTRLNDALESLEDLERATNRRRSERLLAGIGTIGEELNLEYAVIERRGPLGRGSQVVPFSLAAVLQNPSSADNQALQAGDVVTIFSSRDLRVPLAQRKILVRVEGEVRRPGVYQVSPNEGMTALLERAGGLTPDAYLFGLGLYREEVRRLQQDNLQKIARRLEQDGFSSINRLAQSGSVGLDAGAAQLRVQALQQAQQRAVENLKSLKPEGRVALNLKPSVDVALAQLPALRFSSGDRLVIPHRPDFVYVVGAVNTESAVLYRKGSTVADYLTAAGVRNSADEEAIVLLRADGSAVSNSKGWWGNEVLRAEVMPGDSIVLPEKLDRESAWSVFVRNTKDFTQILYQLGLGAAAVRTLRQ